MFIVPQKYPGVLAATQKYPGVLAATQKYPSVTRRNQKYPGVLATTVNPDASVVLPRRPPALLDLRAPPLGVDATHLRALRRTGRRPGRLHAKACVELGRQALERKFAVARLGA
jgi:hypothetical protein